MKTTKKGFTLIELIVVIAIIGVLAAILVPSMLGYVRKSKITSANSAASNVQKAFTNALTDADARGFKCTFVGWIGINSGTINSAPSAGTSQTSDQITAEIKDDVLQYFENLRKVDGYVYLKKNACVAAIVSTDGNYIGTYPSGYVDAKDYKSGSAPTYDSIRTEMETKEPEIAGSTTTSGQGST